MTKNSLQQLGAALCGLLLTTIFVLSSCTKPTDVGADLLNDDQLDVNFTDTVSLLTSSVKGDSVRTFTDVFSLQQTEYFFGQFNDPVFGKTTSTVIFQLKTGNLKADFRNATLDSMVLVLPYEAEGQYGDIDETFSMDILRLTERIETEEDDTRYYSNDSFSTEAAPIQSHTFTPMMAAGDSLEIWVPDGDEIDTIEVKPQLRIPFDINGAYAQELFNADTTVFENTENFLDAFNGMQLVPTSENAGLVNFAFKDDLDAGFFVYYTQNDTAKVHQFFMTSTSLKMTTYEHDYTGSIVEGFLQGTSDTDSLLFIQGLAGVNGEIEIPYVDALEGDRIINKAVLEVYIADLAEDDIDLYTPVENLILSQIRDDGTAFIIDDVAIGLNTNLNSLFGGFVEENTDGVEEPSVYKMNITAHLQEILAGRASNKMRLSVYTKPQKAERVILYGANHSEYPMRLRISYTDY